VSTSPATGRVLDAALHLLDRQIVDCNTQPVCKVDDVELTHLADGTTIVTALLCGPAAFGPRLGGRLGEWIVAVHGRIASGAGPVRIPFEFVKRVERAVDLTVPREETGALELDHWVLDHVIGKIPGVQHAPAPPRRPPERARASGRTLRLSELIGITLHDERGNEIGEVHDVRLVQDGPLYEAFGAALRVDALVAGSGSVWQRLGYDRPGVRGPALLRGLARRASRNVNVVPWARVRPEDLNRD
jgi:sporulation protein YlmC with PRC-barrel domain